MSIRYKILGPIALLVVVSLIGAASISWTSIQANKETIGEFERLQSELHVVEQMLENAETLDAYANDVLQFNEIFAPSELETRLSTHRDKMRHFLIVLENLDKAHVHNSSNLPSGEANPDSNLAMQVERATRAFDDWTGALAIAFGLENSARVPTRMHIADLHHRLENELTTLRLLTMNHTDQSTKASIDSLFLHIAGALGLILVITSLTSGFVIYRGMWQARTLNNLARAMEDIRGGDYGRAVGDQARNDEVGEIARGVAAFSQTLDDLTTAQARIEHLALHDDMTGLANRVNLLEKMDNLLGPDSDCEDFAVLHIDLDRFKEVNDTYGHAAGDHVLMQASKVLLAALGPGEIAARIGGDEFVVIMNNSSEEIVAGYAQCLIEGISAPLEFEGKQLNVGASVGIAFSSSAPSSTRLLACADIALYLAKSAGRGQHCFFTPQTGAEFESRAELARDLRKALDKEEITAFFQPQIDGASGKLIGAEALVRWRHPTRGLLAPGQFLDLVNENGLGDKMTEVVFAIAVQALADWRAAGLDVPCVSVNFTERQLRNAELMESLPFIVDAAGLVPSDVAIEIVESVIFGDDASESVAQISALRDMGFRIELDDFGTDHASISNLSKIEVDRVKIDRGFVTGVTDKPKQEQLLKAIIDLCHNLEVECLAEGVETASDYSRLLYLGCQHMQGYGIAVPMDKNRISDWFSEYAASPDVLAGLAS